MTLRVALIGYGRSGQLYHAPFIEAVDGLDITSVVTGNPDRRAEALAKHPRASVHSTIDELFARTDDFDIVVVATTNDAHASTALRAITAGKATLIDKPLARSTHEAITIAEAARQSDVPVTVYHSRRFDGDFLTLQRLLSTKALGEVNRFVSRFDRWDPIVADGWRESADPALAGGRLFDLGSHLVDQALQLFGPADLLYSEVRHVRLGAVTDDDFFLALQHDNGVISHLGASLLAAEPAPRYRLIGTNGTYTKWGVDPQADQISKGVTPRSADWGADTSPRGRGTLTTATGTQSVDATAGDYCTFYEQFRDAVLGSVPVPVPLTDAVAVLEILDAARNTVAGTPGSGML